MRIQDTYNLSLREFCKFYNTVKVAGVNNDRGDIYNFLLTYIVPLSLALKFTNISVHDEFIKGKNVQPLLDLYDNVNIPCWRSHPIHEKRAPYPFVQSHAIHCSEPLNSRREPLQFMK